MGKVLVFFEDIKLVAELTNNDKSGALKRDLRAKYDLLCQAMRDATQQQLVTDNIAEYSAICNLQVMEFALASASIQDLNHHNSLYAEWHGLAGNTNTAKAMNLHKVFKGYLTKISPGLVISANKLIKDSATRTITISKFTVQDLYNALTTFGAKAATAENMEYAEDMSEIPDEATAAAAENLFSDTDFEDPIAADWGDEPVEEVETPVDETPVEEELPVEADDGITDEEHAEEIPDEEPTEETLAEDNPDDDPEEEAKAKNLDEQIEQFKKSSAAGAVNNRVAGLVRTFMSLYESGFTGIPQEGILFLTDSEAAAGGSPVILIDKNHQATPGSRSDTDNFDLRFIYNSLKSEVPDFGSVIFSAEGERVPYTEALISNKGICFEFHLALQSRSIDFAKGLISIRRFITKQCGSGDKEAHKAWLTRENAGNQSSITVIDVIEKWYKWATERILYKVLIDKFGTVDGMNGKDMEVRTILNEVGAKLRNAIVLDSKEKGAAFTVKISHVQLIDNIDSVKGMADEIASVVDGSQTKVTAERAIVNGVGTVEVIVNADKANSANLFAADVVDKLLEAGIRPSWSKCMLGKSAEGGVIFWDKFRNPDENTIEKRCYTIFAGSRSGKGVMTSTLIASAVSEGVDVFYVDGKPENGPCLGLMAWEQGLDAFVYDGKAAGAAPFSGYMENYTQGIRGTELVSGKFDQLPSMFKNSKYFGTAKFKEFAGLMRYLKSMYLLLKIATGRSEGDIPKSNWNLWVFDEMTSMCKVEAGIRDIFVRYLGDKNVKTTRADLTGGAVSAKISKGKFLEEGDSYDENIAYIDSFKKMMDEMSALLSNAITIHFGKGDMNVIFIFQNASWLSAEEYKGCMIRKFVMDMSKSTTKIVGKGALANACAEYGDASCVQADWYKKYVNTKAKWWAISSEADLRNNCVELFKPYQIWTIPNHMKTVYATAEDVARIKAEDPTSDVKVGDEIAQNGKLLTADEIMEQEAKHPGYYKKFFAGYMKTLEQKFGFSSAQILNNAFNYANDCMNSLNINFNNYGNITEFVYDYVNLIPATADATQRDVEESMGADTNGAPASSGSNVDFSKINNGESEGYGESENSETGESQPTPQPASQATNDKPFMEPADPADQDGIYKVFERRLKDANFRPNGLPSLAKMINSGALLKVTFDEDWDATKKQMYMQRFDLANKVIGCRFNPQERTAFRDANQVPSLRYHTIIIGCLWVVTHNGGNQDIWNKAKIAVFNKAQQFAGDVNNADKFAAAVITHGIMDDIDNSVLGLTEPSSKEAGIPTADMLRGYLEKATSGQTQANPMPYKSPDSMSQEPTTSYTSEFTGDAKPEDFEYNDMFNNDTGAQSWENQPEQAQPVEHPFFTGFGDGTSSLNPRPTQNVNKVDPNAIVANPPTHGGMYSMKKKMFETVKGTSYAMDQYWEAILSDIAKAFHDSGMITKVHIYNDRMKVNGRPIDLRYIIGGEYGIEMCDIVNIPKLFKKFKGIRELALDEECERCLLYQYGMLDDQDQVPGLMEIFDANPKLQKILVMVGGKSMQITRTSLMAAGNEINKHMRFKGFKEKMDGFSCAHDKKLANKSPGRIKRFNDTMSTKTGGLFESAYKQLVREDPRIGKALGLGVLGAAAGAVTLGGKIVGAPFAIFNRFKKN